MAQSGKIYDKEEYYSKLKAKGYTIEFTNNGVIVTPPKK